MVVGVLVHVVVAFGALSRVAVDVVVDLLGLVTGNRLVLNRQEVVDGVGVLVAVVLVLDPGLEVIED